MSTQLTPHFSLEELTVTNTGLPNTPTELQKTNLKLLCNLLEEVRLLVKKPLKITSGFRSTPVNRAVGGAGNSYHLYGLAADFIVEGMTPKEVCKLIESSNLLFDQCILEFDRWTHIAIKEDNIGNRKQLLTIRKGTGYVSGII